MKTVRYFLFLSLEVVLWIMMGIIAGSAISIALKSYEAKAMPLRTNLHTNVSTIDLQGLIDDGQRSCDFPRTKEVYDVNAFTGITSTEFNEVIDKAERVYTPIIAAQGARLQIVRSWSDGTVNAQAWRVGSNWMVEMFGGFARYPGMYDDSFLLVLCHEIGHHIGGSPHYPDDWASDEGQSDYWGAKTCMKRILRSEDNVAIVAGINVDREVVRVCDRKYASPNYRALCKRIAMAGLALSGALARLEGVRTPRFETPDPTRVSQTTHEHPGAQCRNDTYWRGDRSLTRPRCWYRP